MNKPNKLAGLTVLVTGAASGIGRQMARDLFWQERCNLLLLDQDARQLEVLQDELAPRAPLDSEKPKRQALHQPSVHVFSCDIASPDSVAGFMEQIAEFPVDILINNAGIFYLGLFERMALNDFERVIEVNLLGGIRMTKEVLPKLLQSRHAFIVNIASMAGLKGAPGMCAYATSKFGMVGFSEALAIELDGRVGICTVCPTFIKTDIANNTMFSSSTADQERSQKVGVMNTLLSMIGSNPRTVSKIILRAVKERKKFVLVNPDAYVIYYMNRFFPRLSDALVSMAYRKMLQAGVIDP